MNGGDRLVGLIEQGVAAQNLHARGHGSGHRVVVALVLLVGSRLAWPWLAGHTFHPEGEARKECFHPCLSGLTESGKVASLRTQLLRTTFKVGWSKPAISWESNLKTAVGTTDFADNTDKEGTAPMGIESGISPDHLLTF